MKITRRIHIWLTLLWLPFSGQAQSFSPSMPLEYLLLEHWGTDKGLPSSHASRVAQTEDGFLWISSYDGLSRFDGEQFVVFGRKNIPALRSNIVNVLTTGMGYLWVGTNEDGLYSYHRGQFVYHGLKNRRITALHYHKQKVYVGTQNGHLLVFDIEQESFTLDTTFAQGNGAIYGILVDSKQNLWVSQSGEGVWHQTRDGSWQHYTTTQGLPTNFTLRLFETGDGRIWCGSTQGIAYWDGQKFHNLFLEGSCIVHSVVEDDAGNLWFGTSVGLFRQHARNGTIERFTFRGQNPLLNITDLCYDREGSLWISTYRDGLFRLREPKFLTYTQENGFSKEGAGAVCHLDDGSILAGSNDGQLFRIRDLKVSPFVTQTPLPALRIFHLLQDRQKRIFVATFYGLLVIHPDGREQFLDKKQGLSDNAVRVLMEDRQGNIWVGTRWGGITILDSNLRVIQYLNKQQGKLPSNFIMSLEQAPNGDVFIGTNESGLLVLRADSSLRQYTTRHGLGSNTVFSTLKEGDQNLWVCTTGGLSYIDLQNGTVKNYSSREGLPHDSPFDMSIDENGNIWLFTAKGIVRGDYSSLLEHMRSSRPAALSWQIFYKDDGIKTDECTGAAHSLRAPDGSLWVPANGGLIHIQPNDIPQLKVPPLVHITDLEVDDKHYLPNQRQVLELAPNPQRITLRFTACSFVAPQKITFKYRLQGFDEEWHIQNTPRMVSYTNLPPGNYRLEVYAANADGQWSHEAATIDFRIQAAFYETIWFYIAIPIAFIFLVGGFYAWRIQNIERQKEELEEIVKQRTAALEEELSITLSSIQYAKLLQESSLPDIEVIRRHYAHFWRFYHPKDIISGDFYWFSEAALLPTLAVADCTGHGVPGAFMSIIGQFLLNEVFNLKKTHPLPEAMRSLHDSLLSIIEKNGLQDGMEIGICQWDASQKALYFSGARHHLIAVNSRGLQVYKGAVVAISALWGKEVEQEDFPLYTIPIEEPTWFYLFSDGYKDQFGGPSGRKLGVNAFYRLLQRIASLSPEAQQKQIEDFFFSWKGGRPQVDDILVVGFRLAP
ncbi:MAG: hypothetical protein KatS3mg033_0593 [Thermonema sp.]|nr:MAG: hypothetical protein KatS3mg033_0593 [Thermonema sp.]